MTEQKIGALATMEKLTKIWVPEGTPREGIYFGFDGGMQKQLALVGKEGRLPDNRFIFRLDLGDHVQLDHVERWNGWTLWSTEPTPLDEPPNRPFAYHMGAIIFADDDMWDGIFTADLTLQPEDFEDRPKTAAARKQFTELWLPYFRRNCWLSGCDIECNAEEKREWIRGLSGKEIEAWQLRI